MNNKRIHELLELLKDSNKNKSYVNEMGQYVFITPVEIPINEILQHLLEVDIENRKIKESWESNLSIALNGFGLKEEKSQKDN